MTEKSSDHYYRRNNLDKSSSPYLLQHSGNPIWWQEWKKVTIDLAAEENKPVLVSIGYSTCHWCHVMAAEAFSDTETADYLNYNYICIKIDREQRPDIDQYMMTFMQAQSGSGGWPLNVFLTPDLRPVVALTYAPAVTSDERLSFLELAKRVKDYLNTNDGQITPFIINAEEPPVAEEGSIARDIGSYFDDKYGGFGTGQKFPNHSTLLFLLYFLSIKDDDEIKKLITSSLDAMILGGLNDHLQGGIFRYCVDRKWTIPHFEKMLYDQAMALWTYSLAYKLTADGKYKRMGEKILKCLEECFEDNGLYITAFNADTGHEEGATYLWSREEIESHLSGDDYRRFRDAYNIDGEPNFEGKYHLTRKNFDPLTGPEEKLLAIRKTRIQPSADNKILCGINALAAIALIQAGRFLKKPELERKAEGVIMKLLDLFWGGSALGHSSFKGLLQKQSFLSDAGAMLTSLTMLYENDEKWGEMMKTMMAYVESFRKGGKWVESAADDFQAVQASWFDHPVPAGVSLAEYGLTRASLLTSNETGPVPYRRPLQSDFYNINALMCNNLFHLYTTKNPVSWKNIPPNSLQKRGEPETDCYNKVCRLLDQRI
jgi:hypothetical protein